MTGLDRLNTREFIAWPLTAVVQFYRRFLGQGIRSTCPMQPSCSTYAMEALETRGAAIGALMSVDRLNRCGHDLRLYRIVRVDGRLKRFDPVAR